MDGRERDSTKSRTTRQTSAAAARVVLELTIRSKPLARTSAIVRPGRVLPRELVTACCPARVVRGCGRQKKKDIDICACCTLRGVGRTIVADLAGPRCCSPAGRVRNPADAFRLLRPALSPRHASIAAAMPSIRSRCPRARFPGAAAAAFGEPRTRRPRGREAACSAATPCPRLWRSADSRARAGETAGRRHRELHGLYERKMVGERPHLGLDAPPRSAGCRACGRSCARGPDLCLPRLNARAPGPSIRRGSTSRSSLANRCSAARAERTRSPFHATCRGALLTHVEDLMRNLYQLSPLATNDGKKGEPSD